MADDLATVTPSDAETSPRDERESAAQPVRGGPVEVLRLVVAAVLLALVVAIGAVFDDAVTGFVSDVLRGLAAIDDWVWTTLAALALFGGITLVTAGVVVAVRLRAWRLMASAAVAGLGAAGLTALLSTFVDGAAESVTGIDPLVVVGRGGTVPSAWLAAVVGVVAAVSPWVGRRWRRAAWATVLAVAAVGFVTAPVSFGATLALAAGWAVGTAATVAFGAPSQRPTPQAVADGLAAVGCPLSSLEQASVDARGSTPYFGAAADGSPLFVKALGTDQRSADLLFRVYRRLQRHDLGDQRAFSSLRRQVEHEALLAMSAREVGVRTPRLVAFASAEPAGWVLAYEAIAGRSLDRVELEAMTDGMLDAMWGQLGILRAHRMAHRDLRLANVFLDEDGQVWIIDFGFSELAASDLLLANDIAELLASSVSRVGLDRGLAAARRALGPEELRTAADRLRLPMLSGATRTAMKASPGLLDSVAAGVRNS